MSYMNGRISVCRLGRRRSEEEDEFECATCKQRSLKSTPYMSCTSCNSYFHKKCVLKSETALPGHIYYMCINCKMMEMRYMWPFSRIKPSRLVKRIRSEDNTPSNEIVKLLLDLGAVPSAADNLAELPVHKAIKSSNIPVIRTLLNFLNVSKLVFYQNKTLLHYAARYGSLETIKCLVEEYNADVNAKDCIHQTPIFMAIVRGDIQIVHYLERKKADIKKTIFNGRNVLHRAVWHEHYDIINYFLLKGINPNNTDERRKGWTPLHSAAHIGNVPIAQLLICHGAKLDIKTPDDKTALDIAEINNHSEMIKFLHFASNNSQIWLKNK